MSEEVLHYIDNETRIGNIVVGNSVEGDRARFNCHVEDDIQAGINQLNTAGGNALLVKRGTYTITADITFPADGVTVIFEEGVILSSTTTGIIDISGRADISLKGHAILDGNGQNLGSGLIDIIDSVDVYIDGLEFIDTQLTGINITRTSADVSRIVIEDCKFSGCDLGINLLSTNSRASQIRIINCTIAGGAGQGILLDGVMDSSITNVHVSSTGGDALAFNDTNFTNIGVMVSKIWASTGDEASDAIHIEGCQYCAFEEMYINGTAQDGIVVADSLDCSITDCVSTTNTGRGLLASDSNRLMISGCHFTSNGGAGIDFDNVDLSTMTGNNILSNTGNGVDLDSNCDRNIISNNIIVANAAQIVDAGSNNIKVNNILV
jgi:hypothetical protein